MADTRVKIEIDVFSQDQWYGIIRDLNKLFGKDWRGQQRVKRKFYRNTMPLRVWFEIPDEKVASFLQLKYSGLKSQKD